MELLGKEIEVEFDKDRESEAVIIACENWDEALKVSRKFE